MLQSQDFSCVPAACATALNRIGLPTDEATMARLTRTRAGTGSTLLRAMEGLRQRLQGSDRRVVLVAPSYEELERLPMPALTPLQFEPVRRHMVAVIDVDKQGVRLIDPMRGELAMSRASFMRAFRRQVLIFETTDRGVPPRLPDSTNPLAIADNSPGEATP